MTMHSIGVLPPAQPRRAAIVVCGLLLLPQLASTAAAADFQSTPGQTTVFDVDVIPANDTVLSGVISIDNPNQRFQIPFSNPLSYLPGDFVSANVFGIPFFDGTKAPGGSFGSVFSLSGPNDPGFLSSQFSSCGTLSFVPGAPARFACAVDQHNPTTLKLQIRDLGNPASLVPGIYPTLGSPSTIHVSVNIGPLTPPPTVQTLAALSNDVYHSSVGANGYTPIMPPVQGPNGFLATAYKNGGQIVISTRGTFTSELNAAAYNLLADSSFETGNVVGAPDQALISEVGQLAQLVEQVEAANPAAQITLTGHSLGGGISQVVGKLANLQTVTFDAPGPGRLINYFAGILPALQSTAALTPSNAIVDYRMYNDQVSFAGNQVGTSITVDYPVAKGGNAAGAANPLNILAYHSIDTLVSQLDTEPAELPSQGPSDHGPIEVAGAPGPDILGSLNFGSTVLSPINPIGLAVTGFVATVGTTVQLLLDPPPGWNYVLQEDPGAPDLAAIDLPIDDDIAGWTLTFFTRGGASGTQTSFTGKFQFDPGVDALSFYAVDALGNHIFNPDPFAFGLSFASDGQFSATVTTELNPPGSANEAAEPTALPILAGIVLLWTARGRRRPRAC